MAELLPGPTRPDLPRAPITQTWQAGPRQQVQALAETNDRVARENVALHREIARIGARLDRAYRICEEREDDPFVRRILCALDGDTGPATTDGVDGPVWPYGDHVDS